MIPETLLFGVSLLDTGAILFLLVYFVIVLSDLECDYLNAQQCCSKLNIWTVPKFGAHLLMSFLLLITWHWKLFLLNLPVVVRLGMELYKVPSGNMGVYDPTEIHSRGLLKRYLRDCMIYLGFYLCLFFIYLYCMIISLLKGDPIRRHEDDEIVTAF